MNQQLKTMIENQNQIMDKLNIERWKSIDGYNIYSVSTFGRIRNNETGRILKHEFNKDGYCCIRLRPNCETLCWVDRNKSTMFRVHRLVAITLINNPKSKPSVDHIDNNRTNNNINNLRWVTNTENNMNMSMNKNNTSGVKGVTWSKNSNKWCAKIKMNGKNKHLGLFNSLEKAKQARQKAAKKYFGEYMNSCEL
jgi:hypothetical protein